MNPLSASRSRLLLAILAGSLFTAAQSFTPLVDKRFSYPGGIPYQVDTDNGDRGRQTGYNRCNSTTDNQNSLCQTSFINSIDDFCLWAPINPNSLVGTVEGEMVAWCTKPGRGTRVIPAGTLQGVQFMKTPDYVQVVGFIDQTKINLAASDDGGEMDPHGADLRGNPLGGLLYSTGFGGGFKQVIEWHNFLGSDFFCLKACDPAGRNAPRFCEHIYDRIGCAYNAPNNARNGVFESCQGANQDFPGVYVQGGVTHTYTQPPESLGPILSIPYTARVPASSNCAQFASASIYAAGAHVTIPGDQVTTTPTPKPTPPTNSPVPTTTPSSTGTDVTVSTTSNLLTEASFAQTPSSSVTVVVTSTQQTPSSPSGSAPGVSQSAAAMTLTISGAASLMGVVFSVLFFA
ncbi:hypothetical protein BDZ94DRAFT_1168573 [Collybia nuda]|uniref:Macrofage activating glycoprotein n=1 Tax=Collybia nuda TaxID=64659 RepID=A0A9P5Y090_9AGAR|nr:hypothetical protein BDZ94DRAFT_1168573 [Collybia nuda]